MRQCVSGNECHICIMNAKLNQTKIPMLKTNYPKISNATYVSSSDSSCKWYIKDAFCPLIGCTMQLSATARLSSCHNQRSSSCSSSSSSSSLSPFSHSLHLPSQLRRTHFPLSGVVVSVAVGADEVALGALVIGGWEADAVGELVSTSLHPHQPGVSQVVVGDADVVCSVVVVTSVVVLSLQPNHPGVSQVVVVEVGSVVVVVSTPVVSSKHPHHRLPSW